MHQQLWRYKAEEKIYLGVRERKRLNITCVDGTETRPRSERSSLQIPAKGIYLSLSPKRLDGLWSPSVLTFNVCRGYFSGIKWLKRKAEPWPPSSASVKNECFYAFAAKTHQMSVGLTAEKVTVWKPDLIVSKRNDSCFNLGMMLYQLLYTTTGTHLRLYDPFECFHLVHSWTARITNFTLAPKLYKNFSALSSASCLVRIVSVLIALSTVVETCSRRTHCEQEV